MGVESGGAKTTDTGSGENIPDGPPWNGGCRGAGGTGGDGNDPKRKQELDWGVGEETVHTGDGRLLSVAKAGYRGYVSLVYHPDYGVGHVTDHVDGSQHRHDYMADKPGENPIRSNAPYSPIFDVIGKKNPLG